VDNLKNIGVEAYEYKDGFIVKEGAVKGGIIKTAFDHRIGLSFAVLGSVCKGDIYIEEIDSIKVSFPEFFEILRSISYG
jgi:3-phosphoshikimate 1-carboxyvinyltransferase